jgi:hypothetical protein
MANNPFRYGYTSKQTFTPVAEAYGANDVIEGAKRFELIGPANGGEVLIHNVRLMVAHTAVISGETSYNLHLYSVTPPSARTNNAVWDLPSGDRDAYMGVINLGTPVDVGSSLFIELTNVNKQVTVPVGGFLFAELVTVGAFTATAAARVVTLKGVLV